MWFVFKGYTDDTNCSKQPFLVDTPLKLHIWNLEHDGFSRTHLLFTGGPEGRRRQPEPSGWVNHPRSRKKEGNLVSGRWLLECFNIVFSMFHGVLKGKLAKDEFVLRRANSWKLIKCLTSTIQPQSSLRQKHACQDLRLNPLKGVIFLVTEHLTTEIPKIPEWNPPKIQTLRTLRRPLSSPTWLRSYGLWENLASLWGALAIKSTETHGINESGQISSRPHTTDFPFNPKK